MISVTRSAPRKVCVVVNSRANYGRIKSVLRAIKDDPRLELQLVIGASAVLYRFGNVRAIMEEDGFTPTATVYTIVEGETPTTIQLQGPDRSNWPPLRATTSAALSCENGLVNTATGPCAGGASLIASTGTLTRAMHAAGRPT